MASASLASLFAAAVPLAWLVPNHYPPWHSAWLDGLAIALVALAAMLCRTRGGLPALWAAALAVALASVAAQWLGGRIVFGGDALMAALYLVVFGLAIAVGVALMAPGPDTSPDRVAAAFAVGVAAGAVVSTAIAFVQWTGAVSLGIYGVDMAPGGRPYANVAQPNHFCTIAFLGVCAFALLREMRRIGWTVFALGCALLLSGMVISGSRTGWAQVVVLVLGAWWFGRRTTLAVGARPALALGALFVALSLAWPLLTERMMLSAPRASAEQLQAGTRLAHWSVIADAIGREPLWGHGWQQVAQAQQAVALEHPPVGEHIEHSHNIVLDLLVWAGVPVGGLIVLLIAAALARQFTGARDARAVWLLIGVAGVVVHANLEFPLEYAYFLVPVGLALGMAHALEPRPGARRWPVAVVPIAGAALGALLLAVAADYLKAEENHRMLRLESARIGVSRIETPAPKLRLLDQLQAFLEFTRTEARRGMSAAEVERMRVVSERFAYPPAMLRFALAAGLNGQPELAARTLARLCRVHPRDRCDEGRAAWRSLQDQYPELRAIAPP